MQKVIHPRLDALFGALQPCTVIRSESKLGQLILVVKTMQFGQVPLWHPWEPSSSELLFQGGW
jgi:hypothetical protein